MPDRIVFSPADIDRAVNSAAKASSLTGAEQLPETSPSSTQQLLDSIVERLRKAAMCELGFGYRTEILREARLQLRAHDELSVRETGLVSVPEYVDRLARQKNP